ncbi:HK97 family phage prohead protease [Hyphomicrobium sp. MC1]|uniref:HK97 family phage prohead protease n=1 Tax=Hyphomicrobium sp. (strain MC1) TaxID=717785 RepID=UPI000213E1B6|nr:HK97 family phage prohead protease [Hyphomicrobium sp. MC1]CCB65238.1 Peptidase U35 phage prohead HK97 (modular protein) [Hyphomicrobium sp. MC1]
MDSVKRAYSLVQLKRLDSGARTFSGWATTNAVDRMGDTIAPLGAKFANPLALLRGHDSSQPIGTVTFKRPTKDGIEFTAEIPTIVEPGALKDRTDMAWAEVETGIVRAVSIGFRPQKWAFNAAGGIDYEEVEIIELSTVPIPANAGAVIASVGKGMDAKTLAILKSFDARGRSSGRTARQSAPASSPSMPGRLVRVDAKSSPSPRLTPQERREIISLRVKRPHGLTDRERQEIDELKRKCGVSIVVRLTAEDLRRAKRGR